MWSLDLGITPPFTTIRTSRTPPSSVDGTAEFTFNVEIGEAAASELLGKAFIIHGNDGR